MNNTNNDSGSITYLVKVEACNHEEVSGSSWLSKAYASASASTDSGIHFETPNTSDLFYTRSILVSTTINKNDDYFDPVETWVAKSTCIDKPTNIEHDEERIIGHITSSWAIDNNGNLIPDDIALDQLPEIFHIANGAVIYRHWREPELRKQAEQLIKDINDDKMFVSMECSFSGYDYIVFNEDGTKEIIVKTPATSHLSQYLRCYGGNGTYDNKRIGRVLRNIIFSGKGYVFRPANPESVIFVSKDVPEDSFANEKIEVGVYEDCNVHNNKEKDDMSQEQINKLEQQVAELTAANEVLKNELAAQTEVVISELRDKLASLEQKAVKAEQATACMCDQYEQVQQEKQALEAELVALKNMQQKQKRLQMFTQKGYSESEAEAECEKLSALNDDLFAQVMSFIPAKKQCGDAAEGCCNCTPIAPEKLLLNDVEIEDKEEASEQVEASIEEEVPTEDQAFASLREKAEAYFTNKWLDKNIQGE